MELGSRTLTRNALPLTLGETAALSEQVTLIHVKALQSMGTITCPLFGCVGPFRRGEITLVPLHLVRYLTEEHVATPELPRWLHADTLEQLLKEERATDRLQPCPHPYYIEIARLFIYGAYNPWVSASDPYNARREVIRLFEDLVAIRRKKVLECNSALLRQRVLSSTLLSHFERRRLGTVAVDHLKRLETSSPGCADNLEDLCASLSLFDAATHYKLLEKAQAILSAHFSLMDTLSVQEETQSSNLREEL